MSDANHRIPKRPPISPIMKYFEFEHLPKKLLEVSSDFSKLAWDVEVNTPNCDEKSAGLRKLLEAKDCIVRANLIKVI